MDFVIPYSISTSKASKSKSRAAIQNEIRDGYENLLRTLEQGGLKVGSKAGRGRKGHEEVWIFVGASDEKVDELVQREK